MPFDEFSESHRGEGGGGGGGRHNGLTDLAAMSAASLIDLASARGLCHKCLLVEVGGAMIAQIETMVGAGYNVDGMPPEVREGFETDLRRTVISSFEKAAENYESEEAED